MMSRRMLLSIGLLLTAFQWTAVGQAHLQLPLRMAQNHGGHPSAPGGPIHLPPPQQPIQIVEPSLSAPQHGTQNHAVPQPEAQVLVPPQRIPEAPSASVPDAPSVIDFDTILADDTACSSQSSGPACGESCHACRSCGEEECDPCCVAAFLGLDPCVPVPPIGVDPLYSASFDDIYRAPDCCRGLWANYPAEKMREAIQLRRSTVPPDPCLDCGPQLHDPAFHPRNRPRKVVCTQHDKFGFEPNCPQCQQARAEHARAEQANMHR